MLNTLLRAITMNLLIVLAVQAQQFTGGSFGPWHVNVIQGGWGEEKNFAGLPENAVIPANSAFTLAAWVQPNADIGGQQLIAGLGQVLVGVPGFGPGGPRQAAKGPGVFIGLLEGKLAFWSGADSRVVSAASLDRNWHQVAVSYDGKVIRLYLDGKAQANRAMQLPELRALLQIAPRNAFAANEARFGGKVANLLVWGRALSQQELVNTAAAKPDFSSLNFDEASPVWSVQTRQMVGQAAPQDAWTLPKTRAPFSTPSKKPLLQTPALQAMTNNRWQLNGWQLQAAPMVAADASRISQPGFDTGSWYGATVPGTVLTTLVDRGVYPDPDFGLNNMAIPESLNKQQWWYRTEFELPLALANQQLLLNFNGINYAAEIWVNGARVGNIKGAFVRGQFAVSALLKPGERNAIAVKIAPPPHPGIPHEQSMTAGAGNNGGMLALDGPTFIASEGWDWIPAVRDRNSGLWQNVELVATETISLGDVQVVTALPNHDGSIAEIEITVPLVNHDKGNRQFTLFAEFDAVRVEKAVNAAPGSSAVVLNSADLPALRIQHPKLWWPNGYGEPALHTLTVTAREDQQVSAVATTRFGIREITYELSLLDGEGRLQRVEADFTRARALGQQLINVSESGLRKLTPGFGLWAPSFFPGMEQSPAVTPVSDLRINHSLVLKVNGVRIAARGGNWGMDDWRKRVGKQGLEPYFRLHRDAHLNTIRNWMGQSTEEAFYQLADEYGMLVINDFWASTQNFQLEPLDQQLFLANVADVIKRFRNHASIALWIGRNEGVPQPGLNDGIMQLVHELDGTRYYLPSSLVINLALGGPYTHQQDSFYYNFWGDGFSMEVGVPSFPTLEAFKATVPAQDWWPMNDTWAYHDWLQDGNGSTRSFTDAIARRFGEPDNLEDFERKAQLLNYEAYRAIFEGFNAGLWEKNSGRILWMSQPAWPSSMWQMLSHDYDTHASFYGVQHAAEPVHVQLNASDNHLAVINNTLEKISKAKLQADIYALDGRRLGALGINLDAAANAVTNVGVLDDLLGTALQAERAVLVKLILTASEGTVLSENHYWQTLTEADGKRFSQMPAQALVASVSVSSAVADNGSSEGVADLQLHNPGKVPVLATKLTLLNAGGERLLPAYYSDNYLLLLPGETRRVTIRYPEQQSIKVGISGWNALPQVVEAGRRHAGNVAEAVSEALMDKVIAEREADLVEKESQGALAALAEWRARIPVHRDKGLP